MTDDRNHLWQDQAERLGAPFSELPGLSFFDIENDYQEGLAAYKAPPERLPEEVQQALDHFVQMDPRDFALLTATLERTAK